MGKTSTSGGSTSNTTNTSHGGSSSHSVTNTKSHSEGGSHSYSYGKSWASGKVDEFTQAQRDKYNQDYVQGDKVTQAYDKLQEIVNGKPTFESSYEEQLKGLYDQIMNREKFNYDFNADSMYKMYKDNYTQQGRTAMQDTMGQAASMTGGYASSYGQTAGQQTYQNYLQQLNNMIPELRDQAYQQYKDEGAELLNKYNVSTDAYDREYGQYRDSVADWQSDRAYQQGAYQDERNFDYSQFTDNRNYWNNEYWNEKNAERSNYQITDTTFWEDTNSTSTTNSATSYWDTSNTSSSSGNWSASNSSGGSTAYGNSGSGDEVVESFYKGSSNQTANNTLQASPYNVTTDTVLSQASNEDVQEMISALQSAKTDIDRAILKHDMQKELGMSDAELKLLEEMASGKRTWNGTQIR